jgi:hypothetical protein
MFNTTGSLLQAARAGTVHQLGRDFSGTRRHRVEFPTIAESSVPGFDVSGWYGLLAPAKTLPHLLEEDARAMQRSVLAVDDPVRRIGELDQHPVRSWREALSPLASAQCHGASSTVTCTCPMR